MPWGSVPTKPFVFESPMTTMRVMSSGAGVAGALGAASPSVAVGAGCGALVHPASRRTAARALTAPRAMRRAGIGVHPIVEGSAAAASR